MGLAIIGFSLFLRFILNPLTKPYLESMKKIKDVAPQIEKIKKRYKDDKLKIAQAQADLYREKKINPGAGCLPYLLQIVVLIAFFNVFTTTLSPGANTTERFNQLLYPPLKFQENEVVHTRFLYLDITQPDSYKIDFLPVRIPGPILILAALVQFLSAKVMTPATQIEEKIAKKSKEKEDDIQVAMQKSMIYTFPLFTLIIGINFASGLALYWLVFSLSQMYQQVKMQGWGGLTPLIKKTKLLKLEDHLD